MSSTPAIEHRFIELERFHQDRFNWGQPTAMSRVDIAPPNCKAPMITFRRPPPLPDVKNTLLASQCFTPKSWYEVGEDRARLEGLRNPNPEGHDGFGNLAWLGQGVLEFHASAALLELHPSAGRKLLLDLKTKLTCSTTLSHLYLRYRLHDRLKTRQAASQKLCGQAFLAYLGALHKSDHEPGSISRWMTQLCANIGRQSTRMTKKERKEKIKRKKAERALLRATNPRPERCVSARIQKQRKRNLRIVSSDDDQPIPTAQVDPGAEFGEHVQVKQEAKVKVEMKVEEGVTVKKETQEARMQKTKPQAQVKPAGVVKQEDNAQSPLAA